MDPIKNHEGLVRALRLLNDTQRKVRLVIVGEGPNRGALEQTVQISNLVPEPLLLGYRPDVERLYRMFDVFVLNSFAEGMSNTLLEAMASGLPIICTSVGANPDLIADRQRGLLVKPGKDADLAGAIGKYITEPDTRAAHSTSARQFAVQNFSIASMIDRYVSLYESVA
jgi:glycosyltransferase involved in cell wall biosynthesis